METFQLPEPARVNYLNAEYGLKSWLLTRDHKLRTGTTFSVRT